MDLSTVVVLGLMALAVVLFVSDRLRSDMVAMIILGALLLKDIYAAVSHGVLSKGAAPKIGASVIKKMFMTDTIESFEEPLPDNIEIVPVAPIFAEAIRSIHERTSVSQLFDHCQQP